MEQFRQIGEVVGSLKALMVFQEEIQFNRRQCSLLLDILSLAYESLANEMKQNLRFNEKQTKWKVIEQPLKELHRIFKEVDIFIRQSLEPKDWWVQSITFYQNKSLVDFHIHNILSCISVVIEAIETAGGSSGWDPDEMQKRQLVYAMKYQKGCQDLKVFQWRFGKEYLVSEDLSKQIDSSWEEDKWFLFNKIIKRKISGTKKQDQQLVEAILTILSESDSLDGKLLPCSILLKSKDYHIKRRVGSGKEYKEIQWRGGSFLLRQFHGDIEKVNGEISQGLSLAHPNVIDFFCGFTDDENKEFFLVTELINRDLSSYIKDIYGTKKRFPFTLQAAVDLMIQVARGMEYLHAKKIYHGQLNPSNILVKPRNVSTDGYLHAKVSGFGLTSTTPLNQNETQSFIWYAPEVLEEQEQSGSNGKCIFTEKSDVYSFGMVCFQLLTGKVPFEDGHLQGDNMSRNIRAGERPLFPSQFNTPKYLTNLTRRCWHADPNQRPSFSSICRILRYIKRFLLLNPAHNKPDLPVPTPTVDYCETEAGLLQKFPSWGNNNVVPLSQIPFQMFAYNVAEKEKSNSSQREEVTFNTDNNSGLDDSISEQKGIFPEVLPRTLEEIDDMVYRRKSVNPEMINRRSMSAKRSTEVIVKKQPANPRGRSKPPSLSSRGKR